MCVCGTKVRGLGGGVSHLRAVLKPPEAGQGLGVTRPNHHGEVSFLPLDGHNGSGEIHALHRTWGGVTNRQTRMSTRVIENAPTHKHHFSKHPALLITADVHLSPDVCVCISHCIKVTQA